MSKAGDSSGGAVQGPNDWCVYRGFVPSSYIRAAATLGEYMSLRKYEYDLDNRRTTPQAITDIARSLAPKVGIHPNTAIIKRYQTGQESGAYVPHIDPERFSGDWLTLVTLYGHALLTLTGGPRIDCLPNTTILLKQHVEHSISSPLNQEGERAVLFFGHDNTK